VISPYADSYELIQHIPIMTKEEMEALLEEINNLLRVEEDGQKLMRLLDNRDILEKAIEDY